MITLEKNFNKENFLKFLDNIKFKLFNNWPNISKEDVKYYLNQEMRKQYPGKYLRVAIYEEEIIAVILAHELNWDSVHFGFKCYSIKQFLVNQNTSQDIQIKCIEAILREFITYATNEKIRFVSISIDSISPVLSKALQSFKFNYILTWLDGFIETPIKLNEQVSDLINLKIDYLEKPELDYFKRLASENYFKGGRFYYDYLFDVEKVNQMYSSLVENSFSEDNLLFVIRENDMPVGLFICKSFVKYFSKISVAPLRYLLIDPKYRGKGYGKRLFIMTMRKIGNQVDLITTGFEIHNYISLNLHKDLGFNFNFSHNVFHFWNNF
jgi:GNAT superfamily N-acetyltransferase